MNTSLERAQRAAKKYERQLGPMGASIGRFQMKRDVIPTGILALDYALGIGGWPKGHIVEVFGPPDIGKSSVIGFKAIVEAQAMDMTCGIVCLEPGFDPDWAEKNGVDLDRLILSWPDNGQEAFERAYDFVNDPDIDFVLFDSIGAILRPGEAEEDGKPSQGGQSALITWGVKRLLMPAWKQQKCVMLINQVRDKMNSHLPVLDSPGGHALKHCCAIRVQLKPGKKFTMKLDGADVMIGRQIIAHVLRNKLSEGTLKRALFDYYSMDVDDQPFGVDRAADVLNVGARTGVVKRNGAWYNHTLFPGGKLNGKEAVGEFLLDDTDSYDSIRKEVLTVMENGNGKTGI